MSVFEKALYDLMAQLVERSKEMGRLPMFYIVVPPTVQALVPPSGSFQWELDGEGRTIYIYVDEWLPDDACYFVPISLPGEEPFIEFV